MLQDRLFRSLVQTLGVLLLVFTSFFIPKSIAGNAEPSVPVFHQTIDSINSITEESTEILGSSMIVKLKDPVEEPEEAVARLAFNGLLSFSVDEIEERIIEVEPDVVVVNFETVSQLKSGLINTLGQQEIEYSQPVYRYTTFNTPYEPNNDPLFVTQQWYLKDTVNGIRMPSAWGRLGRIKNSNCNTNQVCGGLKSVKVAVVDSGVNLATDDMPAQQIDSANGARFFYNPTNTCNPGEFFESLRLGPNPADRVTFCRQIGVHPDDDGHGSSVSSVIAMQDNSRGGVGVAYNVNILPVALNGELSFNSFIVGEGIEWAVERGAQVINLSLGTAGDDFYLRQKVQEAVQAGVTIVASSGNCGNRTALTCGVGSNNSVINPLIYPAAYPEVIAVGSVNSGNTSNDIRRSSYSSFGTHLDVVAPVGESTVTPWGILGIDQNGVLSSSYTGTSYAAPQVAGLVALGYSVTSSMNPFRAIEALQRTASKVGGATGFSNEYGFGMINAEAFLQYIENQYIDWGPWVTGGAGLGRPQFVTFNSTVYQSIRGTDNGIYTRRLENGNWSPWQWGGSGLSNPSLVVFNNRLYQSIRGTDNCLYTRSTPDGVNWTAYVCSRPVGADPVMIVFNNRLLQLIQGTQNEIYTRSTLNGETWTNWEFSGSSIEAPQPIVHENKLIVAARGSNDGIYTRSSTDGINWNEWVYSGSTIETVTMESFAGRVIQSVRGSDNAIYTRSSTDGVNWNGWQPFGLTSDKVSLEAFGDKVVQSIRGTDNAIYTRHSFDGIIWSQYVFSGSTFNEVIMEKSSSRLFQSVVGTDGVLYSRFSVDGINWSPFLGEIRAVQPPTLFFSNDVLYQSFYSTNNQIYTRST